MKGPQPISVRACATMLRCMVATIAATLLIGNTSAADLSAVGGRKRLLEYGWDRPDAEFAKAHSAEMEQRPFDGVIFSLKSGGSLFRRAPFDASAVAAEMEVLGSIQWKRFTDNFVVVHAAADTGWDWFEDRDWAATETSVRLVARGVGRAKLRGVCFDPEPYGVNPWQYSLQPSAHAHSFPEFAAKVRARGRALMLTVQQELPNPLWFTFFQLSVLEDVVRLPAGKLATGLADAQYGLLVPFLEGMLSAAEPGARIVDGDEWAYFAESGEEFLRRYHMIRARANALVAREVAASYSAHVEVAQPVFLDQVMGLRDDAKKGVPARVMTYPNRIRFLQQNVYWSLFTADQYAWLYSQNVDWWRKPVPRELDQALQWVRDRVRNDLPLGFEVGSAIRAARAQGH